MCTVVSILCILTDSDFCCSHCVIVIGKKNTASHVCSRAHESDPNLESSFLVRVWHVTPVQTNIAEHMPVHFLFRFGICLLPDQTAT